MATATRRPHPERVRSRALQLGLLALCLASAACSSADGSPRVADRASGALPATAAAGARRDAAPLSAATSVGSARCGQCHAAETAAWQESHHARSMQPATPATVLGDFAGAGAHGFSRRGDRFLVGESEVGYTFGVYPLQQYLVPASGGRWQVLGLAWDARPRASGGQRWFDPAGAAHGGGGDGRDQSWNSMCAACHSTGVRKGYDAEHDRYDTTWAELNVGCETCHGPASGHLEWATATNGSTAPAAGSGSRGFEHALHGASARVFRYEGGPIARAEAASGAPLGDRSAEINRCFSCHARRQELSREPRAAGNVLDDYVPSLLEPRLYHADGQLDDEDFEYGSFAQSRMYQAGVTCSNCHDPHSARLNAQGNQLCAQCHAPAHFDQPEHHHHEARSSGAQCVSCHMPSRVFMGVHMRRDHAIRVPNPQLSAALGTPDACAQCHAQKPRAWSAEVVAGWYGPAAVSADERYARAIHASGTSAAANGVDATRALNDALAEVASSSEQAPIRRATALSLLRGPLTPRAAAALEQAVTAEDDLLRLGAARALDALTPRERARLARVLGTPLLHDRTRAVRTEAARAWIDLPVGLVGDQRPQLEAAFREWREARESTAERPEAHLDLAQVYARVGHADAAERELRRALALDPSSLPTRINLADLQRATGRDAEAEQLLRETVALQPTAAVAWHALGLTLVRLHRQREALEPLARAAQLAPEEQDYVYAYQLALRETAGAPRAPAAASASR